MAEYYPLLERAVASMRGAPPEQRRAIYDRARQALLGQLRTMEPAVPEESIIRESTALDEAIARLEADILSPPPEAKAPPPPAPPATAEPEVAVPDPVVAPTPTVAPPIVPPPRPGPTRPGAEALDRVRADRTTATPVIRATRGETEPGPAADAPARPASLPSAPRLQVPSFADAMDAVQARSSAEGDSNAMPPPEEDTAAAIREEAARPPAPRPVERQRFNPRFLILAVVGVLVVAGIAYAAWRLRDKPEALAKSRAALIAAQQADQQNTKVNTRIEGVPAPVQPSLAPPAPAPTSPTPSKPAPDVLAAASPDPAPPAPAPTAPVPAPSPATADSASQPASPAATPDAATKTAAAADALGAAPEAVLPVAQRAAFLVEAPDDPQKIKTYVGTVVWSTDNASPAQNQPIARTVHADVEIPDAALKLSMVFQKNDEAQFPASHTLELRFTLMPNSAFGAIKQINMPQMRQDDSASGDALVGLPVTITDNYFLVGLSRGDSVQRNLDLIKTRNWFDVPMLLAQGKVAKVTFEKGTPGAKAIDEVIQSWK